MAWSEITVVQFLLRGFNADERAKLQSAAGGDDGLQETLDAAVAEWRGVISAAGHDMDEDEDTVPPSCQRHIIAQVRWELLLKFPALRQLQTEERGKAAEAAEEKLQSIANGDAGIESPETPAADVTPGPSFNTPTRNFEREDQDGL